MPYFQTMSSAALKKMMQELQQQYHEFKSKNLKLNMARGKPSAEQLELSADMLNNLSCEDLSKTEAGFETRNYGMLDGIPEAKEFFAQILDVPSDWIIVGGNSSLNLMYDAVARAMQFGVGGNPPWNQQGRIKFLCPSPGYDRHFAICELFGIEMIHISMNKDGPNMNQIRNLVEQDPLVKGIWCVPKYSNPTGITYSDEVVRAFAALKPAAKDFQIFWDNAYVVHHLAEPHDRLLNIFDACQTYHSEDMVLEFTSTSKISFPGGGISALATTPKNIKYLLSIMSIQTIGHDKINQLRHCKFFGSEGKLQRHMEAHAKIIKPKFDLVIEYLNRQITPCGIGNWTEPRGGYFISFDALPGCGKRIGELCKQAGVVLTKVGATYPYGIDPLNRNIRIAPTYPPIGELEQAMQVFCVCVKIASIEKILRDRDQEPEANASA